MRNLWFNPVLVFWLSSHAIVVKADSPSQNACHFQNTSQVASSRTQWSAAGESENMANRTAIVWQPQWFMAHKIADPWSSAEKPTDPLDAQDTSNHWHSLKIIDPWDKREHNLPAFLQSVLHIDAISIFQLDKPVFEWAAGRGSTNTPRLLGEGYRPLASVMALIAQREGKLQAGRPVSHYLKGLSSSNVALRKLSVERLLTGHSRIEWPIDELQRWMRATGWFGEMDNLRPDGNKQASGAGIRQYLRETSGWDERRTDTVLLKRPIAPDDDLLLAVLSQSTLQNPLQLLCTYLAKPGKFRDRIIWVTDNQGTELAGGLSMSVHDYAKFGSMLLQTKLNRNIARIPKWLPDYLINSMQRTYIIGNNNTNKQWQDNYGFVHLDKTGVQVANLTSDGTGLMIDFDRKIVVAFYGLPRAPSSSLEQAGLLALWNAILEQLGKNSR